MCLPVTLVTYTITHVGEILSFLLLKKVQLQFEKLALFVNLTKWTPNMSDLFSVNERQLRFLLATFQEALYSHV